MTYEAIRQPVAEPAPGARKHLHILRAKPHFFMQFAIQRLFRALPLMNAALGKLPCVLPAHTPRPEQLALIVGQDDSYIRTKAIGIYHGGDLSIWRSEERRVGKECRSRSKGAHARVEVHTSW